MDISTFQYKSLDGFVRNSYYTKQIGNFVLSIFIGVGDSEPTDIGLDINKYKYFSVEVCDSVGKFLEEEYEEKFGVKNIGLKNASVLSVGDYYMSYYEVTVNQLEILYNAILQHQGYNTINFSGKEDIKEEEQKTGGVCSVCGLNDPWAYWKNGKAFCYIHIPGY